MLTNIESPSAPPAAGAPSLWLSHYSSKRWPSRHTSLKLPDRAATSTQPKLSLSPFEVERFSSFLSRSKESTPRSEKSTTPFKHRAIVGATHRVYCKLPFSSTCFTHSLLLPHFLPGLVTLQLFPRLALSLSLAFPSHHHHPIERSRQAAGDCRLGCGKGTSVSVSRFVALHRSLGVADHASPPFAIRRSALHEFGPVTWLGDKPLALALRTTPIFAPPNPRPRWSINAPLRHISHVLAPSSQREPEGVGSKLRTEPARGA